MQAFLSQLLLGTALLLSVALAIPWCMPGSDFPHLENGECWRRPCPDGWESIGDSVTNRCRFRCPSGYNQLEGSCGRRIGSPPGCPPGTISDGALLCYTPTAIFRDRKPAHDLIKNLRPTDHVEGSSYMQGLVHGNQNEGISSIPFQALTMKTSMGIDFMKEITDGLKPKMLLSLVPLFMEIVTMIVDTKAQTSQELEKVQAILDIAERKIIEGDLNVLLSREEAIGRLASVMEYQSLSVEYIRNVGFTAVAELSSAIKAFEGRALSKRPLETGAALITMVRALSAVGTTILQNRFYFSMNGESPESDEILQVTMRARELLTRYIGGSVLRRRESIKRVEIENDGFVGNANNWPHTYTCIIKDDYADGDNVVYEMKFSPYDQNSFQQCKNFCRDQEDRYKDGLLNLYVGFYEQVLNLMHTQEFLRIREREKLSSKDRTTFVTVQPDGNVVLYNRTENGLNALWSTGTHTRTGAAKPFRFELGEDGRLRVFDRNNFQIWIDDRSPDYSVERKPYRFLVAPRNLEVRDANNRLVWRAVNDQIVTYEENSPLINPNRSCFTMVQDDGNFVLYCNGKVRWNTGVFSKDNPFSIDVQPKSNIHVMRGNGRFSHWNANRPEANDTPYRLVMQNDQNLVLYGSKGAVWSTGTNV